MDDTGGSRSVVVRRLWEPGWATSPQPPCTFTLLTRRNWARMGAYRPLSFILLRQGRKWILTWARLLSPFAYLCVYWLYLCLYVASSQKLWCSRTAVWKWNETHESSPETCSLSRDGVDFGSACSEVNLQKELGEQPPGLFRNFLDQNIPHLPEWGMCLL